MTAQGLFDGWVRGTRARTLRDFQTGKDSTFFEGEEVVISHVHRSVNTDNAFAVVIRKQDASGTVHTALISALGYLERISNPE
jgi:hypothetical protein